MIDDERRAADDHEDHRRGHERHLKAADREGAADRWRG